MLETDIRREEKTWLCTAKGLFRSGAPDCPVVHRTVSSAPGSLGRRARSREFADGVRLKFTGLSGVHRTVRCAPDCPVSQRSARTNGRPRDQRRTRGRANGRKGHRTVRCAPDMSGAPTAPRSATVDNGRQRCLWKEIGHQTVSGVHRTVWCTRRQKARMAFQICSQRLLAALGL